MNVDASADQVMVDPQRAIPSSNIAATENIGDVYSGRVNPYLIQRLGSGGTYTRLDYTYGIGVYDGFGLETFSRVDDFEETLGRFFLGTDEEEGELQWSLSYDYQLIDYEVVEEYRYERAGVGFGLPIGGDVRLIATGGAETDLLLGRSVGGIDSEFWELGFRLRGGQRSMLELRAGERFFGDSLFGRFEFEGRRLNISVSYSEDPTTSALDGLDAIAIASRDELPADVLDSDEFVDELFVAPVRPELYLSKVLRGRIDLVATRSSVYLSYIDEARDIIDTGSTFEGEDEGQELIILGFVYDLGPKTRPEFAAQRAEGDYVDTTVTTDVSVATISVMRRLSPALDLRLTLRRADAKMRSPCPCSSVG